ncbi:MAG TPA: nitroreductase family protein [Perlabentimonas sp.]|nr:nitroreductase family protein [Bacteroidales bacterium]MDD4673543.1 nitroreductase family protein [Bacteroidales bacterium]HZJ73373.1 nitroreductase family protein [Perlabentimonas sp.]
MDTKTLFKERRSVNFFDKNKPIDETLLKEVVDMAVLAPSAFNLQPWRIIAIRTDAGKNRLVGLANKQEKILDAPVTLIIIGNKDGFADSNPVWDEMLASVGGNTEMVAGAKQAATFLYGSSEDRKLKFAESNAGLLAMSLMIAAKDKGIDSHPMSGIDFDGIHKEFGLKESETVVMLIGLGYFDSSKQLFPRRPRRLFEDITTII